MGGSSKTTQSSSTAPTPFAGDAYTGAITTAQNVAQTPYNPATNVQVAGLDPTQTAAFGQIGALQGIQTPYLDAATNYANMGAAPISSAQIQGYLNPYTNDVVNSTLANIQDNNNIQQQQFQGSAAAQGALGGDREPIGQAELTRQQNLATNQTLAGLQSQGFNTALSAAQQDAARQGQAAYTMGNLGQEALSTGLQGSGALLSSGNQQQAQTQAGLSAGTQNAVQQTMWPYQNDQYLASILGSLGPLLGGTSSGTTTQPAPSPLGAIIGGASALLSSDKRLKENMKPIGKSFDGQTIYKYNYKGDPTTRIGLIAQQVEKKHPEAVQTINGFKAVDYDKATENAADRGHFRHGGGVTVPFRQHFDAGGSVFNMSSMPFNMDGNNAASALVRSAQPHFPTLPSVPNQNQQGSDFLNQYKQAQGFATMGKNAGNGLSSLNNSVGNAVFGSTPTVSDGGWSTSTQPTGGFLSGLGDFLGFAKGGQVRRRYDDGGAVDGAGGFLPFFGDDDAASYSGPQPFNRDAMATASMFTQPIGQDVKPVADIPVAVPLPDMATPVKSETYGPDGALVPDSVPAQTNSGPQPFDYTNRTFSVESSGNPNEVTGSHRGLAQFSPDLEAKYGITDANRNDPKVQASALEQEKQDSAPGLRKALGREPTPGEFYVSHQQGIAGGPALLGNPGLPAWQAILPFYQKQYGPDAGETMAKKAIADNTGKDAPFYGQSPDAVKAGDFTNYWINKFEHGAPQNGQQTASQPESNPVSKTLSSLGLTDSTGTAPTTTGKGLLSKLGIPDFNPLGLNDNQRNALLMAGLSMIGNRSPFASVQIGEGGATGMQTFLTEKQQERQAEIKAKELQQQALIHQAQLQESSTQHAETMRHNKATEGLLKNQYSGGMGLDSDGNLKPGAWTRDANGRAQFVPGMVLTGSRGSLPADPARVRTANWLVANKIAPDLTTAYGMAASGVNDGAAFVRAVQAEKNRISKDSPGSMSDADMETLARKNIMDRAKLAGQRLNGGQPIEEPAPQPPAQPQAPAGPSWWERNAPEALGGLPTQPQTQQTKTVQNPFEARSSAPVVPTPPPSIPSGSKYSPSRKMWKAPDNRLYTETGQPAYSTGAPIVLPQAQ